MTELKGYKAPLELGRAYAEMRDFPSEPPRPVADDIIALVARRNHLTPKQLMADTRKQHIAQIRFIAMYLLREHTNLSFPKIGELCGNRDHSSVINAVNVIRGRIAAQPAFAAMVRRFGEDVRAAT